MVRRPPDPLAAARGGDRAALAALWRTHHAAVLRYLRARRTPSPDDVASQVWIDVATSIARFDGDDDDFRRWLFTIAHRRSVDEVRRTVRRTELGVRAVDTTAACPAVDDAHDEQAALDRAVALVAALPDQQAEAVMLRVVNDLPARDVAAIMGVTEGNVRVLVHRGLTRLRRKIAVTDQVPPAMKAVP
jgi:RNA polymerase sigma-70 factor (ECF subfamily)